MMDKDTCPRCGHDWSAHSAYIARQERMCEEALPDGFSLRIHYTDQNVLWYAQAYNQGVFLCQHRGSHAIALCKQSITRRLKADRGELPMPAPVHTPAGFVDEPEEEWEDYSFGRTHTSKHPDPRVAND